MNMLIDNYNCVKIKIEKDGNGYLAQVEGHENVFAYGESEIEAKSELLAVVEMMMDYHQELVEDNKKMRDTLISHI